MPYRRIQFAPGQYYHIYNRGSGRQAIFREPDNYEFVLRRVKQYAAEFDVAVIAYCLLPNHYHFLLRQDGAAPAGLVMQRVFNSYTKAFNKRYQLSGTLFAGRYQAIHVTHDNHLIHLCRYIHANPVKHRLVARLEDWPYSNYHEWVGTRAGVLVNQAFVREHFPAPSAYRQFVLDYLAGAAALPEDVGPYLLDL